MKWAETMTTDEAIKSLTQEVEFLNDRLEDLRLCSDEIRRCVKLLEKNAITRIPNEGG
jgi:hypothetical protein